MHAYDAEAADNAWSEQHGSPRVLRATWSLRKSLFSTRWNYLELPGVYEKKPPSYLESTKIIGTCSGPPI